MEPWGTQQVVSKITEKYKLSYIHEDTVLVSKEMGSQKKQDSINTGPLKEVK